MYEVPRVREQAVPESVITPRKEALIRGRGTRQRRLAAQSPT